MLYKNIFVNSICHEPAQCMLMCGAIHNNMYKFQISSMWNAVSYAVQDTMSDTEIHPIHHKEPLFTNMV